MLYRPNPGTLFQYETPDLAFIPLRGRQQVFWKIVGIVALVWLAFLILGALIKSLFPILVISAIVFGLYLLYKAMSSSDNKDVTRTP